MKKNKKISLVLSLLLILFPYITDLEELITGSIYIGEFKIVIYVTKVLTLMVGIYFINKFVLEL